MAKRYRSRIFMRLVHLTLGQVLKYKDQLMDLLKLLRDKTFSKRGYTWTGRLLSSVLLTLTHTYPTENKFVNPAEWASDGGRLSPWVSLWEADDQCRFQE
jgi:proteasome activator subunit 4